MAIIKINFTGHGERRQERLWGIVLRSVGAVCPDWPLKSGKDHNHRHIRVAGEYQRGRQDWVLGSSGQKVEWIYPSFSLMDKSRITLATVGGEEGSAPVSPTEDNRLFCKLPRCSRGSCDKISVQKRAAGDIRLCYALPWHGRRAVLWGCRHCGRHL